VYGWFGPAGGRGLVLSAGPGRSVLLPLRPSGAVGQEVVLGVAANRFATRLRQRSAALRRDAGLAVLGPALAGLAGASEQAAAWLAGNLSRPGNGLLAEAGALRVTRQRGRTSYEVRAQGGRRLLRPIP